MEYLQMIQQFSPAQIIVALAILPWIAATLMQPLGTALSSTLDDKWNIRAGAAVRWSGALAEPARAQSAPVAKLAPRRAVRSISAKIGHSHDFFPHAA